MPHWSLLRSAASAQLMVRLANELGVSTERCIAGTGLTLADLADPLQEIEGQQELAVLRNILDALGPTVPFGFLAGLRYHLTTHGMWGFALLSSRDGWSALDVTVRYFDLSLSFNRLSFETHGSTGRLRYDDSDNPDDLRGVLVERDIGALVTFERDSIGRVLPALSLQFRAPPPAYPDPFEELFGVAPRYAAPLNCVDFDLALLEYRPALADARGERVSLDQCRELTERNINRSGIAGRLHQRFMRVRGEFPSMEVVASELGMSTRTLRNHLAREATSFRKLVEQARVIHAEQLLPAGLTIEAIAERLGYSETSTFVAAFKRWKGMSPNRYRQQVQQRRAR